MKLIMLLFDAYSIPLRQSVGIHWNVHKKSALCHLSNAQTGDSSHCDDIAEAYQCVYKHRLMCIIPKRYMHHWQRKLLKVRGPLC